MGQAFGVGREKYPDPMQPGRTEGLLGTSQGIAVYSLTHLELEQLGPAAEAAKPGSRVSYISMLLGSCQADVTFSDVWDADQADSNRIRYTGEVEASNLDRGHHRGAQLLRAGNPLCRADRLQPVQDE